MKKLFSALAILCLSCLSAAPQSLPSLPPASSLGPNDLFYVVQSVGIGGVRATGAQVATLSVGPSVIVAANSPYNVSSAASDNASGILAAIAAANAAGGGTVLLPPGTLKACSQMQWAGNGVSIIGSGEGTSPYSPTVSGGTVIQACASFTGIEQVLLGANSASTVTHNMNVSNISFDGNATASIGLLLRDIVESNINTVNFYHHSGTALEINGTTGNTQAVTSRNLFTNIHIKERNNPGGSNTNGISCLLSTQNTWISIFIEHANGDAINVGEDCDQQTWTTLFTFRSNAETGYAIHLTGDSSSVIGNWNLNGVLTSAQWNMACCSAANTAWTMMGLNTGNFNSGVTESNLIQGSGAAGVEYIDMGGNAFNLKLSPAAINGFAFSSLPTPAAGMMAYVTDGLAANCGDSACTAWGTTVTGGGGSLKLLVWYNNSNWTLVGK